MLKMFGNKRGFLLAEETLKIVVAVIVIVFLVYFLVSIYMAKVNGDNLIQATSLLTDSEESFSVIFDNLEDGGSITKDVLEPRGWYLFGFTGDELKPNSCAGKNCLCICNDVLWEGFKGDAQQKKCDEKGVCLIEESLGDFEDIKITGDLQIIQISKTGGRIYLSE